MTSTISLAAWLWNIEIPVSNRNVISKNINGHIIFSNLGNVMRTVNGYDEGLWWNSYYCFLRCCWLLLCIRYQVMLKCWEEEPRDRPTFLKLKETMKEIERNHKVSSKLYASNIQLTKNPACRGPCRQELTCLHWLLPQLLLKQYTYQLAI